jgi:hypothetical protein
LIRVEPAPEPDTFDARVRRPGLQAIAELVGEEPPSPRTAGRTFRKLADRREEIPAAAFPPYWRRSLDDLLSAYRRICAYTCFYIEPVTGAPTADHMIAKSSAWDQVYEWLNYRLACSAMNSRKGISETVLDPFDVENGWFLLDLIGFALEPAERLPANVETTVRRTIELLDLNDRECRRLREMYASEYWGGQVSFDFLRRRAPHVAAELKRQGRLRPEDARPAPVGLRS